MRLTECDQTGGEPERVGGERPGRRGSPDLVRLTRGEEFRDGAEHRVRPRDADRHAGRFGGGPGCGSLAAEEGDLSDALEGQAARGLSDPRVVALAEHQPARGLGGPAEETLGELVAHGRLAYGRGNLRTSASETSGCTSALTSPPKRATSRTSDEER